MNVFRITTLVFAACLLGPGGLHAHAAQAQTAQNVSVEVLGMDCSMCARGAKNAFEGLDFVPEGDAIKVDVENARIEFAAVKGSEFKPDLFRKALESAGFGMGEVTINGETQP